MSVVDSSILKIVWKVVIGGHGEVVVVGGRSDVVHGRVVVIVESAQHGSFARMLLLLPPNPVIVLWVAEGGGRIQF